MLAQHKIWAPIELESNGQPSKNMLAQHFEILFFTSDSRQDKTYHPAKGNSNASSPALLFCSDLATSRRHHVDHTLFPIAVTFSHWGDLTQTSLCYSTRPHLFFICQDMAVLTPTKILLFTISEIEGHLPRPYNDHPNLYQSIPYYTSLPRPSDYPANRVPMCIIGKTKQCRGDLLQNAPCFTEAPRAYTCLPRENRTFAKSHHYLLARPDPYIMTLP